MLALMNDAVESGAGVLVLILVLFFFGRALRSDMRLTRRLEQRIDQLERLGLRSTRRIHQLEAILRAAGIPVPPWPGEHDDHQPATSSTRSTP